jgi:hypothetical protein
MFELFLFRGLPADVTERFHRRSTVRHKSRSTSVMPRGAFSVVLAPVPAARGLPPGGLASRTAAH